MNRKSLNTKKIKLNNLVEEKYVFIDKNNNLSKFFPPKHLPDYLGGEICCSEEISYFIHEIESVEEEFTEYCSFCNSVQHPNKNFQPKKKFVSTDHSVGLQKSFDTSHFFNSQSLSPKNKTSF